MLIELHTHTSEFSPCSKVAAIDLVLSVYRMAASGVVFTDHHHLWPDYEIDELRSKCDIPSDFLIFSGQEVFTRDYGDILVFGADESIQPGPSLASIKRRYPKTAIIWAHPYRSGLTPNISELFNPHLDAIEIINPHHKLVENLKGLADWKTWGFTASSGTDIHTSDFPRLYPVDFKHNISCLQDLISCIKDGLCEPNTSIFQKDDV